MSTNNDKFEQVFKQGVRTDFKLDIEQKIVNRLMEKQTHKASLQKRFSYVFLFLACCLYPLSLSILDGLGNQSIEWFIPIIMGGGLLIMLDSIVKSTKLNSE